MSDVSRRSFMGGSLALGTAALILPGRAAAVPATVPAQKLFQTMGINGHSWYTNNIWYQRLMELGVPNLRAKAATNKDFIGRLGPFFASGGKLNATIVHSGDPTLDKAEATKNIAFLKNYVGLLRVSGIEGPNEFNSDHPANWVAILRDFVKWLHDTVRADTAFKSVPIIGPSIWKRLVADYQALGDISPWIDKGCIHFYSTQRRPTMTNDNTMPGALSDAKIIAPSKPLWMTETGWQAPNGPIPVSVRCQAKYVVRDFFDAFGFGVEKVFTYQIMDDQDKQFGLCDAGGNPKPAFTALKNTVALVKDQYAGRGALGYSIAGAPASLKSFTFSKSDGTYLLVLYLDVESYDAKARKDLEYAVPVTVNLSASARKIEVFQPTFSASVKDTGRGNKIPLFATDHVTVVKVTI